MCWLMRRSLFAAIYQSITLPLCPIYHTLRTQQIFSGFPNLEPHWKDVVSKPQWRFRAMQQETCAPSQKMHARRLFENGRKDGSGVLRVTGLFWGGQCLKCCTMSNKDVIAKVRFLFEYASYILRAHCKSIQYCAERLCCLLPSKKKNLQIYLQMHISRWKHLSVRIASITPITPESIRTMPEKSNTQFQQKTFMFVPWLMVPVYQHNMNLAPKWELALILKT